MAYSTINDPSAYFQSALWTGNGGTQSITNNGNSNLQPDWLWTKRRDGGGQNHHAVDSTRGSTKPIVPNDQDAESTKATGCTSFNTDGFSVGADANYNSNSNTFVGWQWKANGGTTSSNSSGDITSTVQANTTAGFSIIKYEGNGSSSQTVGHGLGAVPECLIWKNYDPARSGWNWKVWHKNLTGTNILVLNQNTAQASSNGDMDALPTSTLFTVGTNGSTNDNGYDIICYAFTSIKGYSKFGKYEGTGNANGPFIYTGFKPAFVMIKRDDANTNWMMYTDKIPGYNVITKRLVANTANDEDTSSDNSIDFTSVGFKLRSSVSELNAATASFIYIAFADQTLVGTNNVPATAR